MVTKKCNIIETVKIKTNQEVRMKKIVLLCLVLVLVTGCTAYWQRDITTAITPDNESYPDRESYIKATGLDKNPENPVAVITAIPYDGIIETKPALMIVEKRGYLELCVAKALKEVIPNVAVYFDIRPDTIAIYKVERAVVGGDAVLVRRSKLTSGSSSWFVEIYGNLAMNNKTIELNGAGAKPGALRLGNNNYCLWNACLDVANQIADVLVKEGYLREDQIKKAKVEK
jgi:hypothetical protein